MKVTVIPTVIGALETILKDIETGGHRNKRPSGDHFDHSIIKISQNTEKSPGDLRRLMVTQTLVRNHQLCWCEKISRVKYKYQYHYREQE